ncbi:hypothetical protein V1478_013527 [Vespula squamosa]|uniref:Uncharacterized protein n=1 Tax=Vespula squamosa TaxID=30214 RepID=A0ABD2A658_VESSQ
MKFVNLRKYYLISFPFKKKLLLSKQIKNYIHHLYSTRPMYTNNITFFNISFTLSFHINYVTYKHIYFRNDGKVIEAKISESRFWNFLRSLSILALHFRYIQEQIRGRRYNIYCKTIVIVIVLFINYCLSLLFAELCNVGRIKALNFRRSDCTFNSDDYSLILNGFFSLLTICNRGLD